MPAAMPANALSAVGVQGHGVAGRQRGMGHASPAVSLVREDACGDGRLGGRAIASGMTSCAAREAARGTAASAAAAGMAKCVGAVGFHAA